MKAWCAALVWTALQRVPLPPAVLELLVPGRARETNESLQLIGRAGEWLPITADPGGTEVAMLWCVVVFLGWALGQATAAAEGRRRVLEIVGAAGTIFLTVSALHWVTGSERLYGYYTPRHGDLRPVAPLMNPNHFGGFAAFIAVTATGLAITARSRVHIGVWASTAVMGVVSVVLAGSKGGILGLLVGGALLSIGAFVRRSVAMDWRRWGVAALLAVAALAGVGFTGHAATTDEFERGDYSKVELSVDAASLAISTPWTGVGRGGFQVAYAARDEARGRVTHPENLLVQWVVEWGIPFSLLLLFVLARSLVVAFRAKRLEVIAGSSALVGLVFHDMVDFSLELPAVALAAAVAGGAVTRPPRDAQKHSAAGRIAVAMAAMTALVSSLLGPSLVHVRADRLRDVAERWPQDGSIVPELESALLDHPLSGAIVVLGAWQRQRADHPSTIRWLNRAMVLDPSYAGTHLLAAQALWERGARTQAALELREAESLLPGVSAPVICWFMEREMGSLTLVAAPAKAEDAVPFLDRAAACPGASETAIEAVDRRLRELAPGAAGPAIRAARRLPEQERAALLREALGASTKEEDRTRLTFALVRELRSAGALREGAALLDDLPHDRRRSRAWLEQAAEIAVLAGDDDRAEELFSMLRGRAAGDRSLVADARRREAAALVQRGDLHRALAVLEQARRLSPDRSTLLQLARLAERAGMVHRARGAYDELCRGGDDTSCDRARRLGEPRERPPQLP